MVRCPFGHLSAYKRPRYCILVLLEDCLIQDQTFHWTQLSNQETKILDLSVVGIISEPALQRYKNCLLFQQPVAMQNNLKYSIDPRNKRHIDLTSETGNYLRPHSLTIPKQMLEKNAVAREMFWLFFLVAEARD